MGKFEKDVDSLYYPITREIFNEPVLAAYGFIYEKEPLMLWFENNNTSSKTDKIYLNSFENDQEVNKYPEKRKEQYILQNTTLDGILMNDNI